MARPHMQLGVGHLEDLFTKSKSDLKVLKQLEHELQFRQVPRAVALLAEVQAAMYLSPDLSPAALAKSSPSPSEPASQPTLWDFSATVAQPSAQLPSAVAAPMAQPSSEDVIPASAATSPLSAMPTDAAYTLLKATPGSTWESIEQTRRSLLKISHPENLRKLPESKRTQVLAEAKAINEAYVLLFKSRCAGK